MTGALTLNGAPTSNLHAATKKYVDDNAFQRKYIYNITVAGSTVSGNDANGNALSFVNGTNLDVYRNGVLLVQGTGYTVNVIAQSITFTTALAVGAVIQVNVGGVGSVPNTAGVTQILAGTGITLNPGSGIGAVTVGVNSELLMPVGAVIAFGMNSAPAGWLICNGDTVPNGTGTIQGKTANFSALYTLLGASHGAAGNLPDLRGLFVRGSGTSSIGSPSISYTGTFALRQEDAVQSHSHNITAAVNGTGGRSMNNSGGAFDIARYYSTEGANARTADETRPANVSLLYCIKY